MVGTQLPLVALEHQYVVTGPLSEVQGLRREIPVTRDAERSFYLRQEGEGLLIGFYETEPKPWCVDRVPWEFSQQLLPADSRRIEGYMSTADMDRSGDPARRVPPARRQTDRDPVG